MDSTLSNCKISRSFAPFIPQTRNSSQIHKNLEGCVSMKLWRNGQRGCGLVIDCAKNGGGSLADMDAKIELEGNLDFVVEGKCKGETGIVELMECLECEAITGENQGKEASDYNRRAQIFDKSAQVFQALKEKTKERPVDA